MTYELFSSDDSCSVGLIVTSSDDSFSVGLIVTYELFLVMIVVVCESCSDL